MMASSRGSILSTLPLIIGRWRGIIWGYALVVCSKWIRRAWSTLERNQHFVGVWPKWRRKSIHHYHVTCVAFNVSFSPSQVLCVMTVLLWMKQSDFQMLTYEERKFQYFRNHRIEKSKTFISKYIFGSFTLLNLHRHQKFRIRNFHPWLLPSSSGFLANIRICDFHRQIEPWNFREELQNTFQLCKENKSLHQ